MHNIDERRMMPGFEVSCVLYMELATPTDRAVSAAVARYNMNLSSLQLEASTVTMHWSWRPSFGPVTFLSPSDSFAFFPPLRRCLLVIFIRAFASWNTKDLRLLRRG